jgi:hypothetical protein
MDDTSNIIIVVARFNEDLNWINEFPFNQFKYIVYNKGNNDNFEKNNVKQIINLENVGVCDHTYLYHIIENYHNLSNIIVFLPGSVNMQNKKNKAITILSHIINSNYNNAYFHGYYTPNLKNEFKNFQLDKWRYSYHDNFIANNQEELVKCKIRPYSSWYKYFFGNTIAHWYSYYGIFSIDKRDVLQHPISKYQFLIQTLNKHSNTEASHYIERSWGAIFFPLIHTIKIQEK